MGREALHAVVHGSQRVGHNWATELNCALSSPAFHIIYSAYKLNKQGDNIQPWHSPFPVWNQSVVPCLVLTVASWPAHRFLRRQVRWSGIPISWRIFQFVVIHRVKGFDIVNKAEVGVFLEFSCFSYVPSDVGNLISGFSAFSKSSLSIWKFVVHILLKPGLENFKHHFTSVRWVQLWVVWALFGIAFRQCQRMLKLRHNCTHLTRQQSNA